MTGGMRVRVWAILERAVSEGITYGWNRAHKHAEHPDEELLKEQIERAVLAKIEEYFEIEEHPDLRDTVDYTE